MFSLQNIVKNTVLILIKEAKRVVEEFQRVNFERYITSCCGFMESVYK